MMTHSNKVLNILNEQRHTGKLCDINFQLDSGFRTWAHFSVIAAQSEFVGDKYFVQTDIQFSIRNPLTIELQHFECELCLRNVMDFMYDSASDGFKNKDEISSQFEGHKSHIQQLARLLSIGSLLNDDESRSAVETGTDTIVDTSPVFSKGHMQVEEINNKHPDDPKVIIVRPKIKTFQYKIQTQPAKSKMHKCKGCSFTCYKPTEMLFHLKNCTSKNTKCNLCDKHFETMTEFKGHLVRHEHPKIFFCLDCDQRFITKSALDLHTPKHSQITLHSCPDCGKRFKWKHNLNNHILVVHSTERQLLCDECGYSTSHLKTLRAHQLSHTGFSYRCTSVGCSYSSRRKENLKMHIATHRNETPFVCEVCGHRFSQNKNLKRHALLHVPKNLHKCPHCEFTNYRTDKMKEHILRQHKEKPLQQLELSDIVLAPSDDTIGETNKVVNCVKTKSAPNKSKKLDINEVKRSTPTVNRVPALVTRRTPVFILPKNTMNLNSSVTIAAQEHVAVANTKPKTMFCIIGQNEQTVVNKTSSSKMNVITPKKRNSLLSSSTDLSSKRLAYILPKVTPLNNLNQTKC